MGQIDLIKILNVLAKDHKKKIFSVREVATLLSLSRPAAAMLLIRAEKNGLVFRVKNVWVNLLNPPELLEIAFTLVSPSYLSLESALFHHQCLSQSPKGWLTLVTISRPCTIICPLGNIQYFHVKEKLFFGFDIQRIAYAEKALLDLIYLRGLKGRTNIISEEIYCDRFNKKKTSKFLKHFPLWVRSILDKAF